MLLQEAEFDNTFRMSRNSFSLLHSILGMFQLKLREKITHRTIYYKARYPLAKSCALPSPRYCIFIICHSRHDISPYLHAPRHRQSYSLVMCSPMHPCDLQTYVFYVHSFPYGCQGTKEYAHFTTTIERYSWNFRRDRWNSYQHQ